MEPASSPSPGKGCGSGPRDRGALKIGDPRFTNPVLDSGRGDSKRLSRWIFGQFELDGVGYELRRGGVPVQIQRKPLDVLLHLVTHRERTVPGSELLASLWPGVRVSEE